MSDIFEGIAPPPIGYVRARGYEPPSAQVTLELGGPWAFYQDFWRAHNIEHLADLYAPEAQVAPGDSLWVPLFIRNDTDAAKKVRLRAVLPAGWSERPGTRSEEHTSELQSLTNLVCRLLLEKKNNNNLNPQIM